MVPEAKGAAIGVKALAKLATKDLWKAAAERFITHSADHGVVESSVRVKVSENGVRIRYTDNNGTPRGVMAHNEHANEPGTGAHTQTETRGKTDQGSHQPIH